MSFNENADCAAIQVDDRLGIFYASLCDGRTVLFSYRQNQEIETFQTYPLQIGAGNHYTQDLQEQRCLYYVDHHSFLARLPFREASVAKVLESATNNITELVLSSKVSLFHRFNCSFMSRNLTQIAGPRVMQPNLPVSM
jgi:hypothetical protein